MKILLCEDEEYKAIEIKNHIDFLYEKNNVTHCTTFNSFLTEFHRCKFDIIIFDFVLPRLRGGNPDNVVEDFIELIELNKELRDTTIVCITKYSDIFDEKRDDFLSSGVWVVYYDDECSWKNTVSNILLRMERKHYADCLFVCAIEEEVLPFRTASGFSQIVDSDFPFSAFSFDDFCGVSGVCVLQSRMGLTDSAITTTSALQFFQPRMACMVGVCAGVEGEVTMGQAIFADPSWEYMVGKWTEEGMKVEPYQSSLEHSLRIKINEFLEDWDNQKLTIQDGFFGKNPEFTKPIIAPIASGSAVITSKDVVNFLIEGHRKLCGIEMEIAGFYRALKLHYEAIPHFAVKSVMDFANSDKNDNYKDFAAHSSAKIGACFAKHLLSEK